MQIMVHRKELAKRRVNLFTILSRMLPASMLWHSYRSQSVKEELSKQKILPNQVFSMQTFGVLYTAT